ncbi:unnamed protein product [Gemmataceae bacterium]|nr:unnamed protein product [Gemmataceae bacterium]VTU01218.1 unnamed protein product [Gemmataceae bacterium]
MRYVIAALVATLALMPTPTLAASGLSDIAATRACWVRAPYALVKCQSEGGRYPARVVRARAVTSEDESRSWLIPEGFDGILPLETVANDVERVAIAGRFLIARHTCGRIVVVDMDAPNGEPGQFADVFAANEFLTRHGVPAIGEDAFRSFESVYDEFGPRHSGGVVVVPLAGTALLTAAVVWVRRRRRLA